jgi:hypothetical protein
MAVDTRNIYREHWFTRSMSPWTVDMDGDRLTREQSLRTVLWILQSAQADREDEADALADGFW